MIQDFEIGDSVRIKGEKGTHTIAEILVTRLPLGWHAIVLMSDGKFGIVDSSGFTDLEKVSQ